MLQLSVTPSAKNPKFPMKKRRKSTSGIHGNTRMQDEFMLTSRRVRFPFTLLAGLERNVSYWQKYCIAPQGLLGTGILQCSATYPMMLVSSVTTYLTHLLAGRSERRSQGKNTTLLTTPCEGLKTFVKQK